MKKIIIEIETVNAAFEDDFNGQIEAILEEITGMFFVGKTPLTIRDINGNVCGKVIIE